MLCDKCQQRDATIFYTEIIGGKKTEMHYCEECAAECTNFNSNIQEATKNYP